MHGHCSGATGKADIARLCLAKDHQLAPPPTEIEAPQSERDLTYLPISAEPGPVGAAMPNLLALGECNAGLATFN